MSTRLVVFLVLALSLGTPAAQSSETMPRVGYISPGSSSNPLRQRRFEAFRQGLRELGYVEGQNIVLEPRPDAKPTMLVVWSLVPAAEDGGLDGRSTW